MTLDEAIEHAERCADNLCGECAKEHRQLARWLRELRSLRAHLDIVESQCDELGDENAKLRDLTVELMNDEVCPRCVKPYCTNPKDGRWPTCDYDDRLHELGIEVER